MQPSRKTERRSLNRHNRQIPANLAESEFGAPGVKCALPAFA
jgi:hypothetical protein